MASAALEVGSAHRGGGRCGPPGRRREMAAITAPEVADRRRDGRDAGLALGDGGLLSRACGSRRAGARCSLPSASSALRVWSSAHAASTFGARSRACGQDRSDGHRVGSVRARPEGHADTAVAVAALDARPWSRAGGARTEGGLGERVGEVGRDGEAGPRVQMPASSRGQELVLQAHRQSVLRSPGAARFARAQV